MSYVPIEVIRNYRLIYLEFHLPNASCAVNAASHDSFYKWSHILVFDSPLERKQSQSVCKCESQLEKFSCPFH